MPRYAAIDIGSNSARLLVADVDAEGRIQTIAAERQVTRLGASVFREGRLANDSIDYLCQVLSKMADTYRKHEVITIRAVATAAVRDAGNQDEFIERASAAARTPIEVISGQEEARLIHLGVQARWPHPKQRVLIVDVGGGSAELILSDKANMTEAFSKPVGAVRLTEMFVQGDPPDEEQLHTLAEYIDEKLARPVERLGSGPFDRLIATSATAAAIVCAINRVPRSRREEADRLRATLPQVRRFFREIAQANLSERRKMAGIGPRRAEIVVAGTAVFLHVMERFRQPSLSYCAAGVRDGVIADLAERRVERQLSQLSREQRGYVEQMARRCGTPIKHARRVAHLSHLLFDGMRPLHKLSPDHGKLLEAAGYLHDIGHFVSDTSHHKHSYYLVANSDLPGFTDAEKHLIALLCRYHRKSSPSARHDPFQQLDNESRRAILMLVPLLRLADSLDRGNEQKVENLHVDLRNGHAVLALESTGDIGLELWAAERVSPLFESIYQLPLSLAKARS
jgi:exopolyphosphatase/guanosine-5'-triphosphate,3'-diphosphate pyrophosphatase